ncbi:synuclein, gamma b (breast cancer-specific protein 1) isoform X1 [Sebastes umbrosus]|uniref:synuclein, gamma b (breast cancer-specific protein 1) isoform X1 n=1 Tax=Sebastes umbrosus TaxID=72105 RepID=UPI0018A12651|nr:synuclein, gamma b (breast cancer-specific protein 1) isoform X1 [Sebastes umbrosus]
MRENRDPGRKLREGREKRYESPGKIGRARGACIRGRIWGNGARWGRRRGVLVVFRTFPPVLSGGPSLPSPRCTRLQMFNIFFVTLQNQNQLKQTLPDAAPQPLSPPLPRHSVMPLPQQPSATCPHPPVLTPSPPL